jgi:hypothetical protein
MHSELKNILNALPLDKLKTLAKEFGIYQRDTKPQQIDSLLLYLNKDSTTDHYPL